jgi:hypothetical protein
MNQLATQQERIPMDSVGVSNTSTGTKIAPQNLGEVVKFAEVMCRADIALPKHLRGNAGACMAVAMQALEWQLSPFAVASKSYSVNGTIAYEAQLIAAVVNTRSGIKGRLRYRYEGEGASLTCTVTGILDGEECVYTSPAMGSITTKNSPLWKSDPQQQLGYFAARSWARRHCPEVILGVYDRDEAEEFRGPDRAKDITSQVVVDPFSDDPLTTPQNVEDENREAGAAMDAPDTFDASTGEIFERDTQSGPPQPDADEQQTPAASSAEGSEPPFSDPSTNQDDPDRDTLLRYARDVLPMAGLSDISLDALKAVDKEWADQISKLSPAGVAKARQINNSSRTIFNDPEKLEGIIEHYAEMLDCSVEDLRG